MKRIVALFSVAVVLVLSPAFLSPARAVEHMVSDYAVGGFSANMTMSPAEGGATAQMRCVGDGGPAGGWEVWCKYPLCYYVYERGGIVCDYPEETSTPRFNFSMCSPTAANQEKQFCATDPARIIGATGDDMFRIRPGANGFLEYHRINREDAHSLKWIEWVPTPGVNNDAMIPAGPLGTFEDFRQFLQSPPSFIRVKKACYPGKVWLCENPPEPKPGACGTAVAGGPYYNPPQIEQRCRIGFPSEPVGDGDRWRWTCDPQRGGRIEQCEAGRIQDAQCGPANGGVFPTSTALRDAGLCSVGTPAAVPGGTGPWSWTCNPPTAQGRTASCGARTNTTPVSSCVSIAYMPPDMRWDVQRGDFYLGAVGDNYWCANPCKEFARTVMFYVEDVTKITEFYMSEEGWDDIMEVRINGVRVWHSRGGAGPWNNGRSCELSTSWRRYDRVDMRPFLRNGLNVYELKTWVQGCGESWSRGKLTDNCR